MGRRAFTLSAVTTLFAASGASCPQFLRNYSPRSTRVLREQASLAEVMSVVNGNTALVQTLYTTDAKISVPLMPALRASLALERPRRFRVRGETSLTGPEVDLGSNDEQFWFWIRRSEPAAVFHCRHDELATTPARDIVPIEPEWVIEALGVTGFDLNAEHRGPTQVGRGRLRIESPRETAKGSVTKVTVVDEFNGWVLEQHMYDSRNRLLASAVASGHVRDPGSGAVLPRHVKIESPQAHFSLDLDLGNPQINFPTAEYGNLWVRPTYDGYVAMNLADPAVAQMLAPPPASNEVPMLGQSR